MAHSFMHFTGKSKSNSKRKQKSTRKQRKKIVGSHVNKYERSRNENKSMDK